jgi:Ca-activated chloride channel family protein
MAEKIVRQFKRIYFPKAENVRIRWPGETQKTIPETIGTFYDGDTLHVFGKFTVKPDGDVELWAKLENGDTFSQKLPLQYKPHARTPAELPGTTARMAAACEIRRLEESKKISALGVKYQLLSRFTNFLAVDVKAANEKAGDLPVLRKTPQMLAAGWGGTGAVAQEMSVDYMHEPMFSRRLSTPTSASRIDFSVSPRREVPKGRQFDDLVDHLNQLQTGLVTPISGLTSIDGLKIHGVSEEMVEALMELVAAGVGEETAVIVFLYFLSQHNHIKQRLGRSTQRIIAKAYKNLPGVPEATQKRIIAEIESYYNAL